nr:CapA family protein [Clostridium rhizosphaerae]
MKAKKTKIIVFSSLITLCLLVAGFFAGYKLKSNKLQAQKNNDNKAVEAVKPAAEVKPEVSEKPAAASAELVITSVGDCTIGHDDKFAFAQSLPDVLGKNNNDLGYFFKNVADIFKADDITTANLETTFTTANKKAEKEFTFKAPPEYAKAFVLGNIEGVNVSNNHIYDYLQQGFNDTLQSLKTANVNYFGEGNKWITEAKGIKVGYLGYRGFSYDNAFLKKLQGDIEGLKKEADFVVVNFHWGEEGKYSPNATQKYLAHFSIDKGADLIVGHHPHVIQGLETYKGKTIAYSMGNFAFGGNKNPSDKDTFILQLKLNFTDKKPDKYAVRVIPCSISSVDYVNNYSPKPLSGTKKDAMLQKLNKLSPDLGYSIKDQF